MVAAVGFLALTERALAMMIEALFLKNYADLAEISVQIIELKRD